MFCGVRKTTALPTVERTRSSICVNFTNCVLSSLSVHQGKHFYCPKSNDETRMIEGGRIKEFEKKLGESNSEECNKYFLI